MSGNSYQAWAWGSLDGPGGLELSRLGSDEIAVRVFDSERGVYVALSWSATAARQVAAVLLELAGGPS